MFISLNTSIYIWVYLASPEYHDSFSMNQINSPEKWLQQ